MYELNTTTVVVGTFAEFKYVLESENSYSLVYLEADIEMELPVKIFSDKAELTIDGEYPAGTGRHTLTDYYSYFVEDAFGIRIPSNISMTAQNLNIIGHNYHGILYVPSEYEFRNVTVTYRNITYSGPQMTYNRNANAVNFFGNNGNKYLERAD